MTKLLVLGCFKFNWQVIDYAKRKGVYTIVTDAYDPEVSYSKKWADEYWMISTSDLDALEKKCREEHINAVFCGLTEYNIAQMIELTDRLGLPCYVTKEQWRYSKDKAAFKEMCKKHGMLVAKDYYEEDLSEIEFPVVVKPVDRAGNYGVSYCDNEKELIDAIELAHSVTNREKILIEKRLIGKEWYATYAFANGDCKLVALNAMYSEPGMPKNCYSVTTTVTDHLDRFIKDVDEKLQNVLKDIGITDGIAWVQVMLDADDRFYAIEMGQRLDGDMMFVPYRGMLGFDFIKLLVDYSLGRRQKSLAMLHGQYRPFMKCGCGFMLWTRKAGKIARVEGLDELSRYPGITIEHTARIGREIDAYRPLGDIGFVSPNCEEMCKMIQKINEMVHVYDEDGEDILIKYTDFDYLKSVYKKGIEESLWKK